VHLVPFAPSEFPILGRVKELYQIDTCDSFNVWFASLTVNEFHSAYPNCEFLGEILKMY
jgi:hypothetical protein